MRRKKLIFCIVLPGLIIVGCRKRLVEPTEDASAQTKLMACLHLAVQQGDIALIRSLIESGGDVGARNEDGCTPLHTAALHGQTGAARILISEGADVNAEDSGGFTALHRAARRGRVETAKLLIEAGANLNACRNEGWTPLCTASLSDREGMVRLLLAHGAQVLPGDTRENECLLRFAVRHGWADLAENVLAGGANANAVDYGRSGTSLLVDAIIRADEDVTRLLITHGADVNQKDHFGMVPLCYAHHSNQHVIRLLLENGADVNAPGVLHTVVAAGEKAFVELFLAYGADVNVKDYRGDTLIDEAAGRGHKDIVDLLRRYGTTP